jgi:hypothetical protein
VTLRTSSGSRRRSSPFSSIRVEGVEEDAGVMPPVADAVEACHAVIVAAHRLAVDDAGARAQAGEGLDNQREAVGQVISRAAIEPHPRAVLAGHDAEAVMLDFVNPQRTRRQRIGLGGEAGLDKAGW